jgi:ADP-dependent NAD(P)H-hydrate dehydratase / NAD(P)H-hydrate epimerase
MKIFSSEQWKAWDADTIKARHLKSIDLMETAANAFVNVYTAKYSPLLPISVFCGPGNNGGDGLAIARMLSTKGYDVKVWLVAPDAPRSKDHQINLDRLPEFGHIPLEVFNLEELPLLARNEIIIDAILGTGMNRPLVSPYEEIIHWINASHYHVVSVDIPSGMFIDHHTELAINASRTITFQAPKLSFLLPFCEKFTGKVEVVDIGLTSDFPIKTDSSYYLITPELARSLARKRKKFSHKGIYGHALLINGSFGKAGAAILAARACLRSGTGLVTNHIPARLYEIIQQAVPEAMASVDAHDYFWSTLPDGLDRYDAVGIGCGIDQKESTQRAFNSLIDTYQGNFVFDADAINLISQDQSILRKIPAGSILTPHLKEFERLFGTSKNCFDRLELIRSKAQEYNVHIILKGAHSQIAMNDGSVYFNNTGNPGMATAGSGDVLAGILTGLLAQGYDSQSACILATYLHGLSGDLAYRNASYESLIASDLIEQLGAAFHTLYH